MRLWEVTPERRFLAQDCTTPEEVRELLGRRRKGSWLFNHPLIRHDTCTIYLIFEPAGRHGESLNTLALRILVDLDVFESPDSAYAGESLHSQCPRGAALFFKMDNETTDTLLDYSWQEFCSDWVNFFRIGDTRPYMVLERAYAKTVPAIFPMDDFWRVCTWERKTLDRVLKRILSRPADMAGDRDRALGWIMAVCVRRLYTIEVWDEVDLKILLKLSV